MKCEIINGRLHVKAGTVTEQWALDQFIGGMHSYMSAQSYIVDASKAEELKAAVEEYDELDAIFGKAE
jgi:hypothetical protein